MPWNWQLPDWPKFKYHTDLTANQEKEFLLNSGGLGALIKNINRQDYSQFLVEILSQEASDSSKIEGEFLDRESLQSSIKRHFGLIPTLKKEGKKEAGVAELLCDVYDNFQDPLTHQMLEKWHSLLLKDEFEGVGKYRTHEEPMQIISNRFGSTRVFFEAPPSKVVFREMEQFLKWFNSTSLHLPTLERAAIAHLYFESIHPFEDGNGRLGRALIEKILSQGIRRPALIAISKVLERRKKEYYAALERCNHTLEINHWVEFLAGAILEAEKSSSQLLHFLIQKSKIFTELKENLNSRQEKVLLKLFDCGPEGFKGGLSAENYIAITKASRATATRDLADLVELGAIIKTGELRHTRYWLNLNL